MGAELWDKGMRYGRRDPKGGIGTTREELAAAVAEVERALAGGGGGVSAIDFLNGLDIPAGAREAVLARVEIRAPTRPTGWRQPTSWASRTSTTSPRRASPAATSGSRSRSRGRLSPTRTPA